MCNRPSPWRSFWTFPGLKWGKSLRESSELPVDTQYGRVRGSRKRAQPGGAYCCVSGSWGEFWPMVGLFCCFFLIYVECRVMSANEKQSFATEGSVLRWVECWDSWSNSVCCVMYWQFSCASRMELIASWSQQNSSWEKLDNNFSLSPPVVYHRHMHRHTHHLTKLMPKVRSQPLHLCGGSWEECSSVDMCGYRAEPNITAGPWMESLALPGTGMIITGASGHSLLILILIGFLQLLAEQGS